MVSPASVIMLPAGSRSSDTSVRPALPISRWYCKLSPYISPLLPVSARPLIGCPSLLIVLQHRQRRIGGCAAVAVHGDAGELRRIGIVALHARRDGARHQGRVGVVDPIDG